MFAIHFDNVLVKQKNIIYFRLVFGRRKTKDERKVFSLGKNLRLRLAIKVAITMRALRKLHNFIIDLLLQFCDIFRRIPIERPQLTQSTNEFIKLITKFEWFLRNYKYQNMAKNLFFYRKSLLFCHQFFSEKNQFFRKYDFKHL